MLCILALTLALTKGTVRLHVTDGKGNPIPRHQVWLEPAGSDVPFMPLKKPPGPLKREAELWQIPTDPPFFSGHTDASGNVAFRGVTSGKPMAVVTTFGPRFDPYFYAQEGLQTLPSMDILKFNGAVYAGHKAEAILSLDAKIEGRLINLETGKPIAGVAVVLEDARYGKSGDPPLFPLDETQTNSEGIYSFSRLPHCSFTVDCSLKRDPLTGLEVRINGGPWEVRDINDASGAWVSGGGQTVRGQASARCDFGVVREATLTVTVSRGSARSMRDWIVTPIRHQGKQRDDISGELLDFQMPNAPPARPRDSQDVVTYLPPGTYSLEFTRDERNDWTGRNAITFESALFTLRPGQQTHLSFKISDIARKAKR
jgi:hypothetical protein